MKSEKQIKKQEKELRQLIDNSTDLTQLEIVESRLAYLVETSLMWTRTTKNSMRETRVEDVKIHAKLLLDELNLLEPID